MNFEVEHISDTKKRLKIDIPAEEVDKELDLVYAELKKTAKVDGFRVGKTPRNILEKYYAGSAEAEALDHLLPIYYSEAVDKSGLVPVASPTVESQGLKLKKGRPLNFSATVEVRPVFELKEYKGIEVANETVEVTDEEMERAIEEIRDSNAALATVEEDRPAEKGDFVVMDFEGFLGDTAFDGGKAKDFTLELGSGSLIEGFEDQIIGAKKGQDLEVKVKFPDDYRSEGLKGQDALFKVTVNEIKMKSLPELDDELAKDCGLGDTLEEMKEKVRAEILAGKKSELTRKQKHDIIRKLTEMHEFEVPQSLVEGEFRNMLIRQHQEMMKAGMSPKQAGFDMDEFEKRVKPIASERVKTSLLLSAIAEKENIGVSDEEAEAFLQTLSYQAGKTVKELKEAYTKREGGIDELKEAIGEEKILDMLFKEARLV